MKLDVHSVSMVLYILNALAISNPNWMRGMVCIIPKKILIFVALIVWPIAIEMTKCTRKIYSQLPCKYLSKFRFTVL